MCQLQFPGPGSAPLPSLTTYHDGFRCTVDGQGGVQCAYICRTLSGIKEHCRKKHSWINDWKRGGNVKARTEQRRPDPPWRVGVSCQRFFVNGPHQQYFQVCNGEESLDQNDDEQQTGASAGQSQNGEQQPPSVRDQVERQLAQKLRKAELSRVGADQTAAAKYPLHLSPWLEMTRWPGYLHGCDLEKTAQLIELPLHIPDHLDFPLLELLSSFDRVIEEARNSIAHEKVNVFDQHRVNSFIRQRAAYKPILTKLQEGTYKRYKHVWKRLICFVYRVAYKRQGPPLHYLLTDTQSLALGDVLDAARMALTRKGDADPISQQAAPAYRPGLAPEECKAGSKDDSLAELKALQERLDDSCLRFCTSLLDHSLKGNIYDSVIVGFFAVLGINVSTGGFHEAAGHTSHLSAFIKMAQMLVMQRAVRASDLGEVDFPAELLDEMQDRFMVYGSRSPMNWAQKLRTYGAKVRDNTTSLGFIIWSDDRQHLSYKDFELDIQQLRWFVRDQVELAQAQLEELLLVHPEEVREDVVPAINMHGIKDNPSVSEAGWCFLSDGRNQEQFGNHDHWLLNRVLDNKWLQGEFLLKPKVAKWSKPAAERYMQQVDAFLERLLLLMHMTGGQPARQRYQY
ncbi:hypothetical protein H2199_009017 [Coniosporium tulheliwenetii]|uniref:Uncharacterized protein n=1 Tax=Coniosporium tulheliwenetii TaxID=3383036 RepID=A0ACC2YGQ1_9PEZI|nr:hypothetical protein H2199_009017 [Cladosporium sp. JES 115]